MPDRDLPQPAPRLTALLAAEPVRIGAACLRAVAELARARLVLRQLSTAQIADLNEAAGLGQEVNAALVNTVAAIVPGIAPWLPWRSDCLVQALAAQHWLAAHMIASQIVIGADRTGDKGFEAHAWLRHGERVITGGVVTRYTVLLDPEAKKLNGNKS